MFSWIPYIFGVKKTAGTLRKKSWAHLQTTRGLLSYGNKKYPLAKNDSFICSV